MFLDFPAYASDKPVNRFLQPLQSARFGKGADIINNVSANFADSRMTSGLDVSTEIQTSKREQLPQPQE